MGHASVGRRSPVVPGVLGEERSGISTRSLRTGQGNFEILDGDVLRRPPGLEKYATNACKCGDSYCSHTAFSSQVSKKVTPLSFKLVQVFPVINSPKKSEIKF